MRFLLVILGLAVLPLAAGLWLPDAAVAQDVAVVDYAQWEKDAQGAEDALAADRVSSQALKSLRERIVAWRSTFGTAQNANAAQIETVKAQIAALGPAPTEEKPDAPEIADRRKALSDQLEAPGTGPCRRRGLQPRRWPDPADRRPDPRPPGKRAAAALADAGQPRELARRRGGTHRRSAHPLEGSRRGLEQPRPADRLKNNLPVIVLLLAIAGILLVRGPDFIERLSVRLLTRASIRGGDIVAAVVSLGQVIVPVLGMVLLVAAMLSTGMTGMRSRALISALPQAAFYFFTLRWLASWLFRSEAGEGAFLTDRPAEARFHVNMIALMAALEAFRRAFITEVRPPLSMAAQAVWAAPFVCILAIFLFRLGLILRPAQAPSESGRTEFRDKTLRLIGTAVVAISVVAPALALVGYVAAANALIWPTVASLGLLGLILLLQRFATDIYLVATRSGAEGREALLPVLVGFGLAILALPAFALIWGARTADLSELWTRFSEGLTLGETRLSPAVLLTFLLIFAIGYALTRLTQGALKSAILPRTKLEKGVQNALVSGLGYLGIFLAALVAITGAGIDLSALGYVVGALSVGIGFGLQNIVQNFVSGIILLIERPISEGDMIEVNNQTGIVKGISVRSTWIETFDRTDVIVPNADLVSGVVTNLTRRNLTGRIIIPIGVAYGSDSRKVAAMLLEIVEAQPLVAVDPAPAVHLVGFGPDSLNFEIRAILSDVNFKMGVQTEMLHQIYERFAAEGIELPFPQRDIWLHNADAAGIISARPKKVVVPAGAPAAGPAAAGQAPPATPHAAAAVDPRRIRNDPEADEPERGGDPEEETG
ncbi:MAG: mechanosensitive ion channel domain-containing protein [Albidovulum sp.]